MNNIIQVDFSRHNPGLVPVNYIRPKKSQIKKNHKIPKLPFFTIELFSAFIDGVINIFSKAEGITESFFNNNIYFWQSLSTEQKISIFDKTFFKAKQFS